MFDQENSKDPGSQIQRNKKNKKTIQFTNKSINWH
jgi:hypothetical protein